MENEKSEGKRLYGNQTMLKQQQKIRTVLKVETTNKEDIDRMTAA